VEGLERGAAMFKVDAGSIEEYFRFDAAREGDLRAIDELIRNAAPSLSRWFVPGTPPGQPGMTMTMIGYGQYEYTVKNSAAVVTWPVLGLALQKNYISLYPNVDSSGTPFACGYASRLGRARVSSKGVVTFSSRRNVDLPVLAEMISAIDAGLAAGELIAR
jgi:hypothetical protein